MGGKWDPGPFGIMANLAGAVTGRQTSQMNESDRLRELLENLRFLQVRFDKLDGRQCRSAARKLRRTGSGHASDTKTLNPVGKGLRLATSPNQERRGKEGGKVENLENGESGIRHRDAA
ncbi:hypothetical protein BO85DRAFT_522945 [Aspergillus piperis CBS 112811]|uniref:Uncharacterized protein n=1 Tax=Aspergillus piperis CBS 112811 TaxID=1448313 RepID=A0A8G1VKU9_9EURO|nr:hypothetical protein BO85DRAFT_522945 [Aspergillus piperis CBS 112811]RAH54068.1 hypothetical protein BO85DRAFT_522945 [Aspergillus piperis CBS 112811]